MKCCPACGRSYPPKLIVGGIVRQRVVDFIAQHGSGITTRELVDLVWADDPNGGPLNGHNTVSVHITVANHKLRPQGYQIKPVGHTWPARYELVRL